MGMNGCVRGGAGVQVPPGSSAFCANAPPTRLGCARHQRAAVQQLPRRRPPLRLPHERGGQQRAQLERQPAPQGVVLKTAPRLGQEVRREQAAATAEAGRGRRLQLPAWVPAGRAAATNDCPGRHAQRPHVRLSSHAHHDPSIWHLRQAPTARDAAQHLGRQEGQHLHRRRQDRAQPRARGAAVRGGGNDAHRLQGGEEHTGH